MDIEDKETSHAMINTTLKEKRSPVRMNQEWVQALINLRMKYSRLFFQANNSASEAWKLIFKELQESGAPSSITLPKIKKKWMNMMTRYRQIKNSPTLCAHITWPYFDQINRAFGKNYEGDDNVTKPAKQDDEHNIQTCNKIVLFSNFDNEKKKTFILNLIESRNRNRHFFTGKKYAAREGWQHIQSTLECEDTYSVEQLSKCWQNLIQRYKQLKKSNKPISWPYYEQMELYCSNSIDEKSFSKKNVSQDSCQSKNDESIIMEVEAESVANDEETTNKICKCECKCLKKIKMEIDELGTEHNKNQQEILEVLENIQNLIAKSSCD